MAAPLNLERFLGGFAYFIEAGTTVDAQVVSATIKPDVSPLTNWSDRSLGSILSLSHEPKFEDDPFKKPAATGGWEEVPRKYVVADYLNMESREMGENLLRLELGLNAKIEEGTAQTPFATTKRQIDGWLRLQARQETGQDLLILDVWVTLELTEGIKAEGKVTQPKFRFTVIKTVAGVAVAGNSVVFPAAV